VTPNASGSSKVGTFSTHPKSPQVGQFGPIISLGAEITYVVERYYNIEINGEIRPIDNHMYNLPRSKNVHCL